MGILAMNIVAFAMSPQAYLNPLAYGTESAADFASWAFNFIFVDGKMRGLFSFLFGASMLLVIELRRGQGRIGAVGAIPPACCGSCCSAASISTSSGTATSSSATR